MVLHPVLHFRVCYSRVGNVLLPPVYEPPRAEGVRTVHNVENLRNNTFLRVYELYIGEIGGVEHFPNRNKREKR